MTTSLPPLEERFGADLAEMQQKVRMLQTQMANLVTGAVPSSSTGHPPNPTTGMRIYEVDTGLEAYWSGTAWVYPPQLIAKSVLTGTAGSIPLTVPSGPAFGALRVVWSARSDNATAATFMCVRLNGDSGNNYAWQNNQAHDATAGPGNSNGVASLIEVGTMAAGTATSSYLGAGEFVIPNASGSTYKAASGHSTSMNAANDGYSGAYGGLWLNTAAVTSITLLAAAGSLVTGSSAYLYGMT